MSEHEARAHAPTVPAPVGEATPARPRFVDLTPAAGAVTASELVRDDELLDGVDPRLERRVRIHRSPGVVHAGDADAFLRGARVAAYLDHAGVTCVLEAGIDADGHAYVVTPRRTTTGLLAWLADAPSLGRRLTAFEELCRVVAHAHARGVVHGRLAPGCIARGETGELIVDGWEHARVGAPLAAALPGEAGAPDPDPADDLRALRQLLARVLGDDRDDAPELAALVAGPVDGEPDDAATLAARVGGFLDGSRDRELRARMAAAHLARARAYLEDERDPVAAMAEARTALSLDPDDAGAAGLVGRLLLDAPAELPAAARAAVDRSDARVARGMGTGLVAAFAAWTLYVPLMLLQGVRSRPLVVATAVTALVMLAWSVRWRLRGPHRFSWPPLVGAVALMLLYARTFGPFVNAPAEACAAVMVVCCFPHGPSWRVTTAVGAIPVVGAWALEHAGVLARTTWVEAGQLVIASPMVRLDPVQLAIGLAFVTVVLVSVSAGLAAYLVAEQRRMLRRTLAYKTRVEVLAHLGGGPARPGP